MNLKNKKFLVFGIVNKKSIAYAIAKSIVDQGGEVALSYQNTNLLKRITPIAKELNCTKMFQCDVQNSDEIKYIFDNLGWENIDGIIHSIAFAPLETIEGKFVDTDKAGFLQAMEISVYSLIEIAKYAKPLLNKGGSIITMSFMGANRAVYSYKIMGPVKAALETTVKYLASELGRDKIRVNAISAGPIKTLASSAFGGVNETLDRVAFRAPLKENVDQEDVANFAGFLLSENGKRVTGGVHYVDSGLNILGE